MRRFEINKIKDGWGNSLIIDEAEARDEHDLEIGVIDPVHEEHIAWIDLTKEDVVDLRDFLNKHLREETT